MTVNGAALNEINISCPSPIAIVDSEVDIVGSRSRVRVGKIFDTDSGTSLPSLI